MPERNETEPSQLDAFARAKRRRLHQIFILLLGLMTVAAYSNSFWSGFPLDNAKFILMDTRVTDVNRGNMAAIIGGDYWYPISSGLYRPMTTLSILFNYAILGNAKNPVGYHVVNLLLHLLNVALVYLLAFRIFGSQGLAFGTAGLWSVHPLLTESVTNIIGRGDLLAGAAVIGGLLCYIGVAKGGMRWILTLAAIATVGIFSKESAAVLPLLMAGYDFAFHRNVRRRAFAYAAVILPMLLYWWMRSQILAPHAHPFVDNPLQVTDFWASKLTAVKVIERYLWLLVFPRRLSCDYSYDQIPLLSWKFQRWEDWQALLAAAVCVTLVLVAALAYRRHRAVFFWLLFAAVTYFPTSNFLIPIGSIMAERFMYLPAIGFTACVAAGLDRAGRRLRLPVLAPAAIAILCVLFGARTFARNKDWLNDETLARGSLTASPKSFKLHMALAMALPPSDPAKLSEAVDEIGRALQILSALPVGKQPAIAYTKAGELYRRKGESDGGRAWIEKSRDVLLHGVEVDRIWEQQTDELLIRRGFPASRIRPVGLAELYRQLGLTYLALNEPQRALETFQQGLRKDPEHAVFYGLIATAYEAMQDHRNRAIALLEGAAMLPAEKRFSELLPAAYKLLDTGGCQALSLDIVTGRLRMNLYCPAVHQQVCEAREKLARLLIETKREREAEAIMNQAITQTRCPVTQFDFKISVGK